MSAERWSRQLGDGRTLTVEIHDVPDPKPLFGEGEPLGTAELRYPNGAAYLYSSVEKVRKIVTKRGFRLTGGLPDASQIDDDEPPRRAI